MINALLQNPKYQNHWNIQMNRGNLKLYRKISPVQSTILPRSRISTAVVKMWKSSSTWPHISDKLIPRVSTTTQPSGNDKYTRHTHVPVTTPILKSPHIDNNFHSQYSSSVLKITNKNNNNNINFEQNISTVSKLTNNNNNNRNEELIKYLQLEPESKQLP